MRLCRYNRFTNGDVKRVNRAESLWTMPKPLLAKRLAVQKAFAQVAHQCQFHFTVGSEVPNYPQYDDADAPFEYVLECFLDMKLYRWSSGVLFFLWSGQIWKAHREYSLICQESDSFSKFTLWHYEREEIDTQPSNDLHVSVIPTHHQHHPHARAISSQRSPELGV